MPRDCPRACAVVNARSCRMCESFNKCRQNHRGKRKTVEITVLQIRDTHPLGCFYQPVAGQIKGGHIRSWGEGVTIQVFT